MDPVAHYLKLSLDGGEVRRVGRLLFLQLKKHGFDHAFQFRLYFSPTTLWLRLLLQTVVEKLVQAAFFGHWELELHPVFLRRGHFAHYKRFKFYK